VNFVRKFGEEPLAKYPPGETGKTAGKRYRDGSSIRLDYWDGR
jgi:hypothetical protein